MTDWCTNVWGGGGYIARIEQDHDIDYVRIVARSIKTLLLEEKVSLLAGKDLWETVPVPAKGVPAIKVCYMFHLATLV